METASAKRLSFVRPHGGIPAKAGIQTGLSASADSIWIPAPVGMTPLFSSIPNGAQRCGASLSPLAGEKANLGVGEANPLDLQERG
jgi:hypothetical protein